MRKVSFVLLVAAISVLFVCCTMVRSYTTHAYSVDNKDTVSTITTTTAEKYDWTNKR